MLKLNLYDDNEFVTIVELIYRLASQGSKIILDNHLCHIPSDYCRSCPEQELCCDFDNLLKWSLELKEKVKKDI